MKIQGRQAHGVTVYLSGVADKADERGLQTSNHTGSKDSRCVDSVTSSHLMKSSTYWLCTNLSSDTFLIPNNITRQHIGFKMQKVAFPVKLKSCVFPCMRNDGDAKSLLTDLIHGQ